MRLQAIQLPGVAPFASSNRPQPAALPRMQSPPAADNFTPRSRAKFGTQLAATATGTGDFQQTPESVAKVLAQLAFKPGYRFVTHGDAPNNMSTQVQFMAKDTANPGAPADWRVGARKWPIQPNYSPGQIVQTNFMALKAIEEHETREGFRYQTRKIFNPHFDMDDLTRFLKNRSTQATPPDEIHNSRESVQKVLDQCTFNGYKFKLHELYDAGDKMILVLQMNPMTKTKYENQEHAGKKITYLTGKTTTKVVRNLLDALIEEHMKELSFRFNYEGFAMFSNEVPVSHLLDYTNGKPVIRA